MGWCKTLLTIFALLVAVLLGYRQLNKTAMVLPDPDAWWGLGERSEASAADFSIRPFQIDINQATIDDLKDRLMKSRFFEPLENARFRYGFNQKYLQQIVTYWKNNYDWYKWQTRLNSLPQFTTTIQGIDVHFIHIRADDKPGRPRVALMLVHGWPGSFFEFHKAIPALQAAADAAGLLIDLVIPSIPGYGFSSAPLKQGFDIAYCSHIFGVLMERLGYEKYFLQGGDWGSAVTSGIALQRPLRVLGLHVNCLFPLPFTSHLAILPLMLLQMVVPSLIMSQEEYQFYAMKNRSAAWYFTAESGYFFIQGTKPDTVGASLVDSPTGLAAYILEKFSTWTNASHIDLDDGGLAERFTLDELLTNVMVYWLSGNVASSMRFYKENFFSAGDLSSFPVVVPMGYANFPNELFFVPSVLARLTRPKLMHLSFHESGGHFPAFETPDIFSTDVIEFIKKVLKAS